MCKLTIRIFNLWDFYNYRIQEHGLYYLCKFTTSYYPRFLSMGYYDSVNNEVVIALIGDWELRLEHEKGHSRGLKHVPLYKVGYVMHPWGILRGEK